MNSFALAPCAVSGWQGSPLALLLSSMMITEMLKTRSPRWTATTAGASSSRERERGAPREVDLPGTEVVAGATTTAMVVVVVVVVVIDTLVAGAIAMATVEATAMAAVVVVVVVAEECAAR